MVVLYRSNGINGMTRLTTRKVRFSEEGARRACDLTGFYGRWLQPFPKPNLLPNSIPMPTGMLKTVLNPAESDFWPF